MRNHGCAVPPRARSCHAQEDQWMCKVFMECNNYVLATVLLPDRLEVGTLVGARVSNANHAPLSNLRMRNFRTKFPQ